MGLYNIFTFVTDRIITTPPNEIYIRTTISTNNVSNILWYITLWKENRNIYKSIIFHQFMIYFISEDRNTIISILINWMLSDCTTFIILCKIIITVISPLFHKQSRIFLKGPQNPQVLKNSFFFKVWKFCPSCMVFQTDNQSMVSYLK